MGRKNHTGRLKSSHRRLHPWPGWDIDVAQVSKEEPQRDTDALVLVSTEID